MEWSNEMVIEFLHQFETEPVIWDPKHVYSKKKHFVADAWRRIQKNLNWQCTVEDLKKKKDSLMAYYRIHLNKIRKLESLGEEEYRTNWFAFDTMNSFLGSVYDCAKAHNTEVVPSQEASNDLNRTFQLHEAADNDTDISPQPNPGEHYEQKTNKEQDIKEPPIGKRNIKDVFTDSNMSDCNGKRKSECELYGQLLATKLIKLDEDERLILMNNIDNLVFNTTMKIRSKRRQVPHTSFNMSPLPLRLAPRQTLYGQTLPSYEIQLVQSPEESRSDNFILPEDISTPSSSQEQYPTLRTPTTQSSRTTSFSPHVNCSSHASSTTTQPNSTLYNEIKSEQE